MNHLAHFAIHADDVDRARAFYETVFGWTFNSWGPPGFYMISTSADEPARVHGSLQARSEPLTGTGMSGFECSISVPDVDAVAAAIPAAGGSILVPAVEIPNVGRVLTFLDTEGNRACAMQYVAGIE